MYQPGNFRILDHKLINAVIGILILAPAWLSLVILHTSHSDGISQLLFLLILIWIADSAAYFSGRRWGKTKLANKVSPGKTWEGIFGAIFAILVFCYAYSRFMDMQGSEILLFLLLGIITVSGSVLGDLIESLMKRHSGIKDSGTLLPGHGGVMDRIDSLTAAGPIFVAGLWLTQGIQ